MFGDLPERQECRSGGRKQVGYPALVDEGDSVGLRAFATPPEARISHERGVARLIRLVMARDLKPLRRDLAVNVQGEMVYKKLAAHPLLNPELVAGRDLRDDLLDRIVMTVFLEGREPLRSAAAFDARIASRAAAWACRRRKSRAPCRRRSNGWAESRRRCRRRPHRRRADIRAQLAWLMPAGFLLVTPWERLKEFPRYLQAIEQRLEKLPRIRVAMRSSRPRSRRSKPAIASGSRRSAA